MKYAVAIDIGGTNTRVALIDEEYKIDAFTNLVDGYMEKPFSLPVLKARIDSLIKKNYGHLEMFEYKNLSVNFNSYTAKINGEEIDVNAKELEVLKCLLCKDACFE